MKYLDARKAARAAVAANAGKPATATLADTRDARLVVFRILPGQEVPPHRSASSVILTVLEGKGVLTGGDETRDCAAGDIVAFEPNELHGMRASDTELHVLAMITPRPGTRAAGPGTNTPT